MVMFGLTAPFGLGKVISQYVDTMGSYEYCSINAYNFWAIFGKLGQSERPFSGNQIQHIWQSCHCGSDSIRCLAVL